MEIPLDFWFCFHVAAVLVRQYIASYHDNYT